MRAVSLRKPISLGRRAPKPYDVDALRLLRQLRIRRALRWTVRAALLAVPAWAATIILIQEVIATHSDPLWDWADSAWGPGFAVVLAVLAAGVLGQIALRLGGPTDRLARSLVPLVGRGTEPEVAGGATHIRGLLPLLRRKAVLSLGGACLVLGCAGGTVLVGEATYPAWQASRGHGGPTVTIGGDASIRRVTHGGRGGPTYFLSTPYGEVVAEGHPRDGQRWVIADPLLTGRHAYKVGGIAYLMVAAIAAFLALLTVGAAVAVRESARRERRLRKEAGEPDLPAVVESLSGGNRAVLLRPDRSTVVVGLPTLGQQTVRQFLDRRRRRALRRRRRRGPRRRAGHRSARRPRGHRGAVATQPRADLPDGGRLRRTRPRLLRRPGREPQHSAARPGGGRSRSPDRDRPVLGGAAVIDRRGGDLYGCHARGRRRRPVPHGGAGSTGRTPLLR